eukprot:TCONS_00071056-protein
METGTEEYFWVQCEYPQCMKWRKLLSGVQDEIKNIQWYCHMNPDKAYSFCDAPQQKMQVKKGETVVFSELELGSLVMAKMAGYPSWPAIITKDPAEPEGSHIIRYQDGTNDPKYYHVEFLGQMHTHAWISARQVQIYNTSSGILVFDERAMKKKKLKEEFLKSKQEASTFMNFSPEERLKRIIFQWKEPPKPVRDIGTAGPKLKVKFPGPSKRRGRKPKEKPSHEDDQEVPTLDNQNIVQQHDLSQFETRMMNINGTLCPVLVPQSTSSFQNYQSLPQTPSWNIWGQAASKNPPASPYNVFDFNNNGNTAPQRPSTDQKSLQNAMRVKRLQSPMAAANRYKSVVPVNRSKPILKKRTKESVPKKKTKQEAKEEGSAQITTFENEESFWKEFKPFWEDCIKRNINEKKMSYVVKWHGKKISLFKFYQTVQHAGGYKAATSHWKIWTNICCEVIGKMFVDNTFATLKKAYRNILLQFEQERKYPLLVKKRQEEKAKAAELEQLARTQSTLPGGGLAIVPRQSPVYLPEDLGLPQSLNVLDSCEDGSLQLPALNSTVGDILKGLAPSTQKKSKPSLVDLPSSNPDSPMFCFSQESRASSSPTLPSEIGMDAALLQINTLEGELSTLGGLDDVGQDQSLPEDVFLDNKSTPALEEQNELKAYQPVSGSSTQDSVEFDAVMGELTDLEDTLLDMAGDLLGGTKLPS